MKYFLKNVEIHLSIVGILVILLIPSLFAKNDIGKWRIAAITAVLVGAVHGFLFWIIRSRQRNVRNETISAVQNKLLDIVNNNLLIINLGIEKLSSNKEEPKQALEDTKSAITNISSALKSLSEESLKFREYN